MKIRNHKSAAEDFFRRKISTSMPTNIVKPFLFNLYCLFGKICRRFPGGQIESPVFVIGTGRCGTTLLCNVFRLSNKIAVFPTEANEFWHPLFYPYRPNLSIPPIWKNPKIFSEMSKINWIKGHQYNILNAFSGYLFLHGAKKILFVKSAMVSFMIPDILAIFPSAKIIHIYRHSIPVVNSFCKKEWQKYRHIESFHDFRLYAASYWNSCILEIDRVDRMLNLRANGILHELSYENICIRTKSEIRKTCEFIGCRFETFPADFSRIQIKESNSGNIPDQDNRELTDLTRDGLALKGYRQFS
jgi:hypothetical protein